MYDKMVVRNMNDKFAKRKAWCTLKSPMFDQNWPLESEVKWEVFEHQNHKFEVVTKKMKPQIKIRL